MLLVHPVTVTQMRRGVLQIRFKAIAARARRCQHMEAAVHADERHQNSGLGNRMHTRRPLIRTRSSSSGCAAGSTEPWGPPCSIWVYRSADGSSASGAAGTSGGEHAGLPAGGRNPFPLGCRPCCGWPCAVLLPSAGGSPLPPVSPDTLESGCCACRCGPIAGPAVDSCCCCQEGGELLSACC